MRWRLLVLLPAFVALALAGCGPQVSAPTEDRGGGSVPTTPQALALVAAEHAGTPSSAIAEDDAAEEFETTGIGTELRFGADGEDDGDMLVVAVGEGIDEALTDCDSEATEYLAGCVETDQGLLMWEAEAPESDPGVVYAVVDKGDATALLFYAGPAITGDPRELDLPIPTEVLFAIATDPRVDTTTSAATVVAAADLSFWQGPRR